jgi:threonine synthase
VSFTDALFGGLAPDGGLFVPATPLELDTPDATVGSTFVATARWAVPRLLRGIAEQTLQAIVAEAFDFPIPLVEVEPDVYVLELFHGPSAAFKDVGARFMARAMAALDDARGDGRTILVATSGDTGGAVADAFHGLEGYRVAVLFPEGGISARQRRQMSTLGGNVLALAVEGTFDDCQALAKQAFRDQAMSDRHRLASANSINVGRLLPQSLYYLHAAATLGWGERRATFSVPCGNLGNLCAGLLGWRAGMPAAGFLAATNANDVFVQFLRTGEFSPRPSVGTESNAMDVGDPSNLERIRWLYRDAPEQLRADVAGASVTDDDARACIAEVHARTGYVLDPHTAVAYRAAERHGGSAASPRVVLATAHPAKFPDVVRAAIGAEPPLPPTLARRMEVAEHVTPLQPTLAALDAVLRAWRPS